MKLLSWHAPASGIIIIGCMHASLGVRQRRLQDEHGLIRPNAHVCPQLEVLNTLEKNDLEGRWHCVSLREWFNYRGHVCMAFEKLGLSLYDFLRRNAYNPFHVNMVRCACAVRVAQAPPCAGRRNLGSSGCMC
jgi:hypothetical protein